MRWAWLGAREATTLVARLLANSTELELVHVSDSDWESLLVRSQFDAVMILPSPADPLRSEQLKKLVGSGLPVVAWHPAADVLTAYEIEVFRRDTGGILIAFAPGWQHPAWEQLAGLIAGDAEQGIGTAQHIAFERVMSDARREAVLHQLSQDARIVRRMLGNITSVNAIGDLRPDGTWNSVNVYFSSDSGCSANWSISSTQSSADSSVRVTGNKGNVRLLIPGNSPIASWELFNSVGTRQSFAPFDDAADLVEQARQAKAGQPPTPAWSDICLDLEIAEAAEKSLRRKRAIDLFTANRSEEKTFKGFMAATGCLVLMAILGVFLAVALWDGFRSPFRELPQLSGTDRQARGGGVPNREEMIKRFDKDGDGKLDETERPAAKNGSQAWPLWARLWPVYPLLAFLLMQFLVVVARNPRASAASTAGSAQNTDPKSPR